ncbi:DUF722 domain-containing protein [Lactococcus garvieae]|uniref:DUF722 domain-containing protein n=1 Tax=Lactococcus garvieae TaxID=1363 RepID=UPI0030D59F6C
MADKLDRLIKDYVTGNLDKQIQSRINTITFKIKYKSKPDNLGIRTAYKGGSEQESTLLMQEKIEKALEEDEELNTLLSNKREFDRWWPSEDELVKEALSIYYKKKWTWSGVALDIGTDRSTIFRRLDELKSRLSPYIIW